MAIRLQGEITEMRRQKSTAQSVAHDEHRFIEVSQLRPIAALDCLNGGPEQMVEFQVSLQLTKKSTHKCTPRCVSQPDSILQANFSFDWLARCGRPTPQSLYFQTELSNRIRYARKAKCSKCEAEIYWCWVSSRINTVPR
jgi:hypothetical protein